MSGESDNPFARLTGALKDYEADLAQTIAAGTLPDRAAYGEDVSGVKYDDLIAAVNAYASQKAEIERLRAALEPFSRLAAEIFRLDDGREMNAGKSDDQNVWGFDNVTFTYGDLRRIRAALSETSNGKD